MRKSLAVALTVMPLFAQTLLGVSPQKWELRSINEFLNGKFEGISVSYEGILSLSPREEKIEGPAEEFYLSLFLTSEGTAFLGTGHRGNIYRIGKESEIELYAHLPEMDINCLIQDKKGNLFAGTSPNGKIYKITAKDKWDIFFNPQEKYIWDLLFTEKGSLLAAVGENGGIYEISQNGEGDLILKAKENHILCIRIDKNGDLIAGSGGKGLLYRISQDKRASVLFESPYEEIRTMALGALGDVYVAAGGTVVAPKKEPLTPLSTQPDTAVTITVTPSSVVPKETSTLEQEQPCALYKIRSDGMARRLWNSNEDLAYSLLWNGNNNSLIFGTGNKGRIYTIDRDEKTSLLLQKDSEQIYLLHAVGARIYVLSNNPATLAVLYPEQRSSGEYMSRVFETRTLSSWGKIEWDAEVPSETFLQFQTRSGNSKEVNQTWSDWSPPYQNRLGEQILSPKARYIQFKAIFKTQSGKISPQLRKVSLFYLQTNMTPEITDLELLPANVVFLKPPEQEEIIWGEGVQSAEQIKKKDKVSTFAMAKKAQRKGFQTVVWDATDENGDALFYSIFIRREDESEWRVLEQRWTEKIFAFDTLTFPDGIYFVKIEAIDTPSNPLGMDLKSDKTSGPVVIDNSLPVVKSFRAVRNKNELTVSFSAEDSFSYIKDVEFLIRPNEWRSIFPVDGICDSKLENFNVVLALPYQFDNLITIKVTDSYDNIGVYRQTF